MCEAAPSTREPRRRRAVRLGRFDMALSTDGYRGWGGGCRDGVTVLSEAVRFDI